MTAEAPIYALFGLRTADMEAARAEVERLLGVTLHGRVSSQWEDYYSNFPQQVDSVKLYVNWADAEDDLKASDFDTYPLILKLGHPTRIEAQEKLLAASPLLRAERTLDWWHKRDAQGQPRARSRRRRRLGARDDPAG